jgi:hypothetical protein
MIPQECPYCSRTFSSKSGYTQHVNRCAPPVIVSDSDSESDLITDVNNMSLDSEELNRNIDKVKN